MIHDLDVVQWLVGEDVEVTDLHAVGIRSLQRRLMPQTRDLSLLQER